MLSFLLYEGKAAVALAVFYMFYRLLLKKESFHRLNRMVLMEAAAFTVVYHCERLHHRRCLFGKIYPCPP